MTRFFGICFGFQDVWACFIIQGFQGTYMYTEYRVGSGFLTLLEVGLGSVVIVSSKGRTGTAKAMKRLGISRFPQRAVGGG